MAFLYCFGHRKKRYLAPRVHENTPFWPQHLKKIFSDPWREGAPPHPTPLTPSAPRLGTAGKAKMVTPPGE